MKTCTLNPVALAAIIGSSAIRAGGDEPFLNIEAGSEVSWSTMIGRPISCNRHRTPPGRGPIWAGKSPATA
jgi:hypothetical protein